MYLKRKIDEYLLEWKEKEERLPLIIKGARQIGKTESINHFANQNYGNIVSINLYYSRLCRVKWLKAT